MRKAIALVVGVALSWVMAAPAFADCASELKAAEAMAMKLTDAKQKAEVEKHITMAKTELTAKNEKACTEHVEQANMAAKTKPDMKP